MIKKILVATDFTDTARMGVERGAQLAKELNAELLVVYVFDAAPYVLPAEMGVSSTLFLEQQRKAGEKALADLGEKLRSTGLMARTRMVFGAPAQQIIDVAKEESVDLIVLATHGRTGAKHLFMGSVAERVVRTASAPVLTYRAI